MARNATQPSNEGLKHAWDWFDLHAKQRMQTVNFYIALVAAILAATGAAFKDHQYVFTAVLGGLLTLISILFFALERRVRMLVRIGEAALRKEQERLAIELANPDLALIEASDRSSKGKLTYGRIFYAMFVVFGMIGLGIFGASIIAQGPDEVPEPPKAQVPLRHLLEASAKEEPHMPANFSDGLQHH